MQAFTKKGDWCVEKVRREKIIRKKGDNRRRGKDSLEVIKKLTSVGKRQVTPARGIKKGSQQQKKKEVMMEKEKRPAQAKKEKTPPDLGKLIRPKHAVSRKVRRRELQERKYA